MNESNVPKLKVYCGTSFWSYLVGGPTSDEKIARWQALTRRWWETERGFCDVFVSNYVRQEASLGDSAHSALRLEAMSVAANLPASPDAIVPIAEKLLSAHAIPPDETTDALHVAMAAFHGMDVLLTWNYRHLANLFTFPKTIQTIAGLGYECPLIITPERYLEDIRHDE